MTITKKTKLTMFISFWVICLSLCACTTSEESIDMSTTDIPPETTIAELPSDHDRMMAMAKTLLIEEKRLQTLNSGFNDYQTATENFFADYVAYINPNDTLLIYPGADGENVVVEMKDVRSDTEEGRAYLEVLREEVIRMREEYNLRQDLEYQYSISQPHKVGAYDYIYIETKIIQTDTNAELRCTYGRLGFETHNDGAIKITVAGRNYWPNVDDPFSEMASFTYTHVLTYRPGEYPSSIIVQ